MALTTEQIRALNSLADHNPALTTRDGSAKPQIGDLLAKQDTAGTGAAALSVVTADADATYGQPEADLINELKADLNALIAIVAALAD